jgi:hypothetical protein
VLEGATHLPFGRSRASQVDRALRASALLNSPSTHAKCPEHRCLLRRAVLQRMMGTPRREGPPLEAQTPCAPGTTTTAGRRFDCSIMYVSSDSVPQKGGRTSLKPRQAARTTSAAAGSDLNLRKRAPRAGTVMPLDAYMLRAIGCRVLAARESLNAREFKSDQPAAVPAHAARSARQNSCETETGPMYAVSCSRATGGAHSRPSKRRGHQPARL